MLASKAPPLSTFHQICPAHYPSTYSNSIVRINSTWGGAPFQFAELHGSLKVNSASKVAFVSSRISLSFPVRVKRMKGGRRRRRRRRRCCYRRMKGLPLGRWGEPTRRVEKGVGGGESK